jgi:hypothetical protein
MPHANGQKISGRHTTVIDAAIKVVEAANADPNVSKIVLSIVRQGKASVPKGIKIADVPAGLSLKIRGSKTIQELYVYTSDRHTTASVISEAFDK